MAPVISFLFCSDPRSRRFTLAGQPAFVGAQNREQAAIARVIGMSGGYRTCQSKRSQRTFPEARWDRFNLRRSRLNEKRPQRSQQNWGRSFQCAKQGRDRDWRLPQRAELLPVPSRRFTLAGHYPKRNGPSSGASGAVLGRSAQSAERTRLFPRDGLSLRSNHSGLFCSGEWPKKAAPASGKRTLGAAFAAGAIGGRQRRHNSVQLPLVPDSISGLFCTCEWPIRPVPGLRPACWC